MSGDVDWESYTLGLLAGVGLVLFLIRLELWLARPPRPQPVDPFDTLRWDVLRDAREATRDAT